MRNELALRYLLLRHMSRFARAVPPETHAEVARSLRVEAGPESYTIQWFSDGALHERRVPRGEFAFYARGDRRPEARRLGDDLTNPDDARAAALAEEIFGRPAPPLAAVPGAHPYVAIPIALAALLALGLPVFGGIWIGTGLLLAGMVLVELAPRGRLPSCALLLCLAALGPPAAALFGGIAAALLQLLDPDPRARSLRTAVCAGAAALAAWRLSDGATGDAQLGLFAILALAAVLLAALRSFHATEGRAAPAALPFYGAGLALDGEAAAALLVLGALVLELVAVALAHRVRPIQTEAPLPPE